MARHAITRTLQSTDEGFTHIVELGDYRLRGLCASAVKTLVDIAVKLHFVSPGRQYEACIRGLSIVGFAEWQASAPNIELVK